MCNRIIRSLLLACGMLFLSTASFAQVGVSITIAPPELRAYEQPICPGDGYIWTPGYWAWNESDYYWAPGLWVMAPEVGFLWTPGYWGWRGGGYFFNEGYWGTSVGFYGGINYGFGYFGRGYEGGRWDNGHFFYNTTLNNVNRTSIHNVYNTRVSAGGSSRVSFNGGTGGVNARATAQEESAAHARHVGPVAAQTQHVAAARSDPQGARSFASHGTASVGATSHSNTAVHPRDLPAIEHPAAPNTGNAKRDQTYQRQQDKLTTSQNKERQQLQQKQDTEHQQLSRQKASEGRTQQVEQRHAQQTQQMQQRHTQQQQHLQQKSGGGGGGSQKSGHK
jgi:hypothetical protein